MKVTVNQLDDINSENKLLKLKNQELKRGNDLLVKKYGLSSRNANKLSVVHQTEMVGVIVMTVYS